MLWKSVVSAGPSLLRLRSDPSDKIPIIALKGPVDISSIISLACILRGRPACLSAESLSYTRKAATNRPTDRPTSQPLYNIYMYVRTWAMRRLR